MPVVCGFEERGRRLRTEKRIGSCKRADFAIASIHVPEIAKVTRDVGEEVLLRIEEEK